MRFSCVFNILPLFHWGTIVAVAFLTHMTGLCRNSMKTCTGKQHEVFLTDNSNWECVFSTWQSLWLFSFSVGFHPELYLHHFESSFHLKQDRFIWFCLWNLALDLLHLTFLSKKVWKYVCKPKTLRFWPICSPYICSCSLGVLFYSIL